MKKNLVGIQSVMIAGGFEMSTTYQNYPFFSVQSHPLRFFSSINVFIFKPINTVQQ